MKIATANGTAASGSDYTALPLATQMFGTGEQTKAINVTIGDAAADANEKFKLNLSAPSKNLVIADTFGLGTIIGDD